MNVSASLTASFITPPNCFVIIPICDLSLWEYTLNFLFLKHLVQQPNPQHDGPLM
ncbi:unnamed protein product [Haemonchus placei]|uniref:Uncharacterized protein n=1 Tax=Haemonchus placei TaxID=6290 RepID=A0A3P7WD28_HAEPC|nr:unnamed protein product [Haemonchus placei]